MNEDNVIYIFSGILFGHKEGEAVLPFVMAQMDLEDMLRAMS